MKRFLMMLLVAALAAGCGAGRSYSRGEQAARAGDWDSAVDHYRRALTEHPERSDYRIALERAMINASRVHLDQARLLEARGQLEEALREYRRANEFDPVNRQLNNKVQEVERRVREQLENAQPQPTINQLRDQARQTGPPPLLKLNEVLPGITFNNTSVRDILNFIGASTNVNVTFDRDFMDRQYTVQLDNVTLEDALSQVLSANGYFYKVLNDHTILVIPDNTQKRQQYEDQVIRTFFISHADATEMVQMLNSIVRIQGMAIQPQFQPNKVANTITARASTAVMAIVEKVIESNDNPRAEVVIDVQILEVNRNRAKQFGLDLGTYAIGGVFSPERDPRGSGDAAGTISPQPFNLNSISRGINTGDFYLSVPSAVVRFLETDTDTKLIAKPQLRGAEGQKISLNLGSEVPIPSTVFTPLAQGGANLNPLTSFTYKTVGVVVTMTPRVTYEDEIILDVILESSSLGPTVPVGGQDLQSFGTRKVETKIRLRDGESNLIAGLLREDERRTLRGIPGILRLPGIKQLFSSNNNEITQTDIVMLLTPRLVRTHDLRQSDVNPIYIGTQQNFGLGGPPPLIAAPDTVPTVPASAPAAVPAPATPAGQGAAAPPAGSGTIAVVPPGSTTQPGTTGVAAGTPVTPPPPILPPPPTQILVTPPGPEFRVGGMPYTVPISVSNASRLSAVSVTLTYNPMVLRVRNVQEGSFMRQGAVNAQFTQQVDQAAGRIDIAITRAADGTGASGIGLLAAVLFDAIAAGPANITVTGTASAPGGAPLPVQFPTVAVTVR